MRPPIFIIIMSTVSRIVIAENNDNPVKKVVTMNITQSDKPNDDIASFQIVRYCS